MNVKFVTKHLQRQVVVRNTCVFTLERSLMNAANVNESSLKAALERYTNEDALTRHPCLERVRGLPSLFHAAAELDSGNAHNGPR